MLLHDASLGRPFPDRAEIEVDESGNGYALRLAARNGIPYGDLAAVVASSGHRYIPARAAAHVAYLFGAESARLKQAIPERRRVHGEMQVQFKGHIFTKPYLVRHTTPQVCGRCLEDGGYAYAYWDLSLATSCVVHQARLSDSCEACGKRISWRRPALWQCWCGSSLARAEAESVSEAEWRFNCLLYSKLERSDRFSEHPANMGPLRALGLGSLLRLTWALGICVSLPNGKPVPGAVTRVPDCRSAAILVQAALDAVEHRVQRTFHAATLWCGSALYAELTQGERAVVDHLFPEVSERLPSRQLNDQLILGLGTEDGR